MIDLEISILTFLISLFDRFERDDEKLIKSFSMNSIKLQTDTGFKNASYIHLTKSFYVYKLRLANGYYLECADNHIVFDQYRKEIFVKDLKINDLIYTDVGLVRVMSLEKSSTKLCMCDITIDDHNHRYFTNGILSHNTTMSAIFLLWYVLFNVDKNALVLGNKRKTAVEILDKIKKIYLELPYYLKPGVYKWNEGEIVFDNGCRIMAEATTINSGISFTFHCVLADEFAHVAPNIKDKFYNNLFPTITAAKARFMITSTQNGYDLFCRLYKAAEQHLNEYAAFKTDWDEVPEWNPEKHCWEPRDEEWHRLQVANYGSEEAFNKQFGTSFDVNANTLIDIKTLNKKRKEAIGFIRKDLPGVSGSDFFTWKPNYEPSEQLKNDFITVTIDIGEGIGKDFTTFLFNRMVKNGDECIGKFHCNTMNIEKASIALMEICTKYLNPLQHCISLEYNTYGELFYKTVIDMRDKLNYLSMFDESNFIKYYNDSMTTFKIGIRLTSASKSIGCKLFKEQYEKGQIINQDLDFLMEAENFCDNKGNETYQASFGHDDIMMAQIQLVHARQSNAYKYLRSVYDSLQENGQNQAPAQEQYKTQLYPDTYNPLFTQQQQFMQQMPTMGSMDDIYKALQTETESRLRRFS